MKKQYRIVLNHADDNSLYLTNTCFIDKENAEIFIERLFKNGFVVDVASVVLMEEYVKTKSDEKEN